MPDNPPVKPTDTPAVPTVETHTETHTERHTVVDDVSIQPVNGIIKIEGFWSLAAWVASPFVKAGPAFLALFLLIAFIAYEIDKQGGPLLTRYGEYIKGQQEFTATVNAAMDKQTEHLNSNTDAILEMKTQNSQL